MMAVEIKFIKQYSQTMSNNSNNIAATPTEDLFKCLEDIEFIDQIKPCFGISIIITNHERVYQNKTDKLGAKIKHIHLLKLFRENIDFVASLVNNINSESKKSYVFGSYDYSFKWKDVPKLQEYKDEFGHELNLKYIINKNFN